MHQAAFDWVGRFATTDPVEVLDLGGRNINGTVRAHFPAAVFTVLDIAPGVGVDVVADAATWTPDRQYDITLCLEVFEHTAKWPAIVETSFMACRPGGRFIVTCAGPGRAPHSAVDGGPLRDGEDYGNVHAAALEAVLDHAGFVDVVTERAGEDTRASAVRP